VLKKLDKHQLLRSIAARSGEQTNPAAASVTPRSTNNHHYRSASV
jgi:hypothetical protein